MRQHISCTRCGSTQVISTEAHDAWDEISCTECGEFIDTYGHWEDSRSPNYLIQLLDRSRTLTLQMARVAQPSNDFEHRSRA